LYPSHIYDVDPLHVGEGLKSEKLTFFKLLFYFALTH